MPLTQSQVLDRLPGGGEPLRVHLIGVSGSGMSGIAALLLALGHRVSGSDRVVTSETERLREVGLAFSSPHRAAEVEEAGAEAVIYSSAIKPGNVAYDAAVRLGLPLVRRAEALAAVMRAHKGIVVAGTHGKTTTSALAAHVLRNAGLEPSHYVGAEIPILGTNAHLGAGDYFVAEGDESDGTLVNFRPEHAVILNVEAEHLDHYTDGIAGIMRVFKTLLSQTAGTVFFCGDDPGARDCCAGREDAVSYGLGESCHVRAEGLSALGRSTGFTVVRRGEVEGKMILNIPGRHNVLNALGVAALALELGVPFNLIKDAVASFRGAKRRFEVRFSSPHFQVVDDYGHHPTEIAATIEAARSVAGGRVAVVFQPHRYTRTRLLKREFGTAFDGADAVFITDIYGSSEAPIEGVSGRLIVDEVAERGACGSVESTPGLGEAAVAAGNFLRDGDLLLTLGAGNVHLVATRLANDLGVLEGLRDALGGEAAQLRLYEGMARHTTIRIGGPAQFWVQPETFRGMAKAIRHLRSEAVPVRVIGRGSNLLIRDGGVRGAVIHPRGGEFEEVTVEGNRITAGAGVRLKKLTSTARKAGLGGFEWMEGIPGNVGGALRMNAGAMGVQTFDQVVSVRFIDPSGDILEKRRDEMVAHYRDVPELDDHYAVQAVFEGVPAPVEEIDAKIAESKGKRKTSQPVAASAGCIFKNPEEVPAGELVEQLGFKGRGVGKASVSDVHGNFIVNDGGATAGEVLGLIAQIRAAARKERGIWLETEVQILGED